MIAGSDSDVGSSIYTRDDDPDNPMAYNYWEGTPGFVSAKAFCPEGDEICD